MEEVFCYHERGNVLYSYANVMIANTEFSGQVLHIKEYALAAEYASPLMCMA